MYFVLDSNELFFSGRNIFTVNENSIENFQEIVKILGEEINITRKPFRLSEFDNFLASSEETENFISLQAGSDHFIVSTSFGRLIGWGSNKNYQLGTQNAFQAESPIHNELLVPCELCFDAPVKYFVCGPQSTLVLTTTNTLFLTGCLNDFKFSQFTILQQNLSPTEHIEFMHISITNEIFIVTNAGNIYRSKEMTNNRLFMFQRFHDYDSLENGPIWKLLRGSNFYTVLTKSHRFFTTFSESGHHLKTFREISKFKNLRLLDMSVGEQHVLVFGVLKSAILPNSFGYFNQTGLIKTASKILNYYNKSENKETNEEKQQEISKSSASLENSQIEEPKELENKKNNVLKISSPDNNLQNNADISPNEILESEFIEGSLDIPNSASSDKSVHARLPTEITKSEEGTSPLKRLVRQHTPYPGYDGSLTSTMINKSQTQIFHNEETIKDDKFCNNDHRRISHDVVGGEMEDRLEHTSLILVDSTEDIPGELQKMSNTSINRSQNEYEEESTLVEAAVGVNVNSNSLQEIRFINDGIDVTEHAEQHLEQSMYGIGSTSKEQMQHLVEKDLEAMQISPNQALEQNENTLENIDSKWNAVNKDLQQEVSVLHNKKEIASIENIKTNIVNVKYSDVGILGKNLTYEENTLSGNVSNNTPLLGLRDDDDASIQSNHNSNDNPFKGSDVDNAMIERGKYALQQEINSEKHTILGETNQMNHRTIKNNYMRQFYDDLRKNLSCKSEKSIAVIVGQYREKQFIFI